MQVLRDLIGDRPQEVVAVAALDIKLHPVGASIVGMGRADEAPVDTAAILRFVLLTGAPAFVVGHNHPSGSNEPSPADIASMRHLGEAAQIVGLRMVDAFVLGEESAGLREQGVLE